MLNKLSMGLTTRNNIFIFILCAIPLTATNIKITTTQIDERTQEVCVFFPIAEKDFLYKDFIHFSVAHPSAHVSPWKTKSIPHVYYDPLFKTNKKIFKKNVTISFMVTTDAVLHDPIDLYCTYYLRSEKNIKQIIHSLVFVSDQVITPHNSVNTLLDTHTHPEQKGIHHAQPFNTYISYIFVALQKYCTPRTMPLSIHILCIVCLIFLCIFPHIVKKHILLNTQHLHNDITTFKVTSYFMLLLYIVYLMYPYVRSHIMLPSMTIMFFCYGIFYIKKSTKIKIAYLHALCHLLGGICIVATIPLLFKTMQLIMN